MHYHEYEMEGLARALVRQITQEVQPLFSRLETFMSAETDALEALRTDMGTLKDTVAATVTGLGSLTQQIADLKQQATTAGADPAVIQGLNDLDATAKDLKGQLDGAIPAPAAPPAP